jgi:hypothetical protein
LQAIGIKRKETRCIMTVQRVILCVGFAVENSLGQEPLIA